MQQSSTAMQATGGREASRERRMRLGQGKSALPPVAERTRTGERTAAIVPAAPVSPASVVVAPQPVAAVKAQAPVSASANTPQGAGLGGRAASLARRAALVQGKAGLQQIKQAAPATAPVVSETPAASVSSTVAESSRRVAQAVRAARARNGRGDAAPVRPSGRMRNPEPIKYPPKVADTRTYAGQKVTGVRIGRGMNVTGDEPGAALPVTGTQYIGTESGYVPRAGGGKVGAARTAGGLVVTGTQVRSNVKITGDESNPALRITGEADQEIEDDLIQRPEQGAYVGAQFQRMHDPHGHSVFGINLGRSIQSIGSRERHRERGAEITEGGRHITGTAIGRSVRTTGDESGACRHVTGDQYLMPADRQPLCETPMSSGAPKVGVSHTLHGARTTGTQVGQRLRRCGGITGTAEEGVCQNVSGDEYLGAEQYKGQCGAVPAPASGEKVAEASTWGGQRVTGVDVEYNPRVTGDEPGVCKTITGTPYVGPGQYQAWCEPGDAAQAARRVAPGAAPGNRVTGDIPRNVEHVTGTQRGGDRNITGTPYFRADVQEDGEVEQMKRIESISNRFSVRSPQREGQLRAGTGAVEAPTAETRITGSFAAGEGKITGNQEFHFQPRPKGERSQDKSRITGEGRAEGPAITGGAWDIKPNVTGTEGYIAAERNPSERAGRPHAFAGAGLFKGKGEHRTPTHHVTGMVGWSAKAAARVTLSGGAQG
jgi:hypothetical protein